VKRYIGVMLANPELRDERGILCRAKEVDDLLANPHSDKDSSAVWMSKFECDRESANQTTSTISK
jgi:hypothetical protein